MSDILEKTSSYYVVAKNETSGTWELDFRKIIFLEIDNDTCTISFPKSACAQGHLLTIFMSKDKDLLTERKLAKGALAGVVAVTGRIISLNPINDRFHKAEIHFTQFDSKEWEAIKEHYLSADHSQ